MRHRAGGRGTGRRLSRRRHGRAITATHPAGDRPDRRGPRRRHRLRVAGGNPPPALPRRGGGEKEGGFSRSREGGGRDRSPPPPSAGGRPSLPCPPLLV